MSAKRALDTLSDPSDSIQYHISKRRKKEEPTSETRTTDVVKSGKGKEEALPAPHHALVESSLPSLIGGSAQPTTMQGLTDPPDSTHRLPSASPIPSAAVSFLEGAVNTTFNNSTINNIAGNSTILKFDGREFSHCQR